MLTINSLEQKAKVEQAMARFEDDKLELTRNLQMKLDEKKAKIDKFEARLGELEGSSEAMQQKLEVQFENQLGEITRKHENTKASKESEYDNLDSNLNTLEQFKDTQKMRESELRSEEERYAALLHELDMIKRNGIMEQDNQSKKI